MNLRIITEPTTEPMLLEEALQHLNVSLGDEHLDAWLLGAIKTAREHAEDTVETCLTDAVYEYAVDSFYPHRTWHGNAYGPNQNEYRQSRCSYRVPYGAQAIELPLGDVGAVRSITYIDTNGAQQTLDPALYVFDGNQRSPIIWRAYGQTWPSTRCQPGAVTVTFQGRYSLTASPPVYVPAVIKHAMKVMLSAWDVDREGAMDIPPAALSLLGKRRIGMGV